MYEIQQSISYKKLSRYVGQVLKIVCDGIDYNKNCFVGRVYFQAPDIDGKVFFNAYNAIQGEYYEVLIENNDAYCNFTVKQVGKTSYAEYCKCDKIMPDKFKIKKQNKHRYHNHS